MSVAASCATGSVDELLVARVGAAEMDGDCWRVNVVRAGGEVDPPREEDTEEVVKGVDAIAGILLDSNVKLVHVIKSDVTGVNAKEVDIAGV